METLHVSEANIGRCHQHRAEHAHQEGPKGDVLLFFIFFFAFVLVRNEHINSKKGKEKAQNFSLSYSFSEDDETKERCEKGDSVLE